LLNGFIKNDKNFNYKFCLKLLFIIAFWESVIMFMLVQFQSLSPMVVGIIDTGSLTLFSGLSIWYFLINPMRNKTIKVIESSVSLIGQELDIIHQIGMVSAADLQGKIIYANDNFCEVSGYSREELLNKSHNIVNSGKHPKEFFANMWASLNEGKLWHDQVCNKKKNGELYWVDAYIFPIKDNDGKVFKYISFRFEITSEKLVENELEQQKVRNIHMDRLSAIGEMSAGVAHEINNPLAIISGLITVVDKKIQGPNREQDLPKIIDYIRKVQLQISRMSNIIDGLRDFSRSGENEPFENVSSVKISDMVVCLFNEKLKNAGIRFEVNVEDVEFQCNYIQIEQVIVNLIGNSFDAISQLEERWIKLNFSRRDNFIEISVTDSGLGIDHEISTKIMEPFYTTKGIGKGTGLGLSISNGIVEKHGGILYVDSESINTRFVLQIPLDEGSLLSLISIDESIKSHLAWRNKLINLMTTPDSDLDPEFVSCDCNCVVGKWILRIEPRFNNNFEFIKLKSSHTAFHKYAGEIVRITQTEGHGLSELVLGSGSEYDKHSTKVVSSLKSFRSALSSSTSADVFSKKSA
jgi:PAS domain S-box-containing protein